MTENPKTIITLDISLLVDLDVENIWPDGDAPSEITAEAVADLINSEGGIRNIMEDWCLMPYTTGVVRVTAPNPDYQDSDPLFPEHAPRKMKTTVTGI